MEDYRKLGLGFRDIRLYETTNMVVNKEIDLKELIKGDTIDMKENGCRWEGDSLQHKPFGYGCIYNSENQIIYKGK